MNRRPLLVVRPEPGNAATLAAAQALGLAAHGEPLFRVVPRPWTPPPAAEFDALLIGSGNVLRHGGPALGNYETLPAYVVGETTAQAARAAGFTVGATGSGGLQDLVPRLVEDGHRRVLRLAGAEHVPLRAGPDTGIETVVVYAAETLQLGNAAAAVLAQQPFVLLHSAAAAARFAAECDRLRVDRGTISLACLGPRVAAAAGIGWASVASAERPSDSALLALAAGMCQTGAFGKTDANN